MALEFKPGDSPANPGCTGSRTSRGTPRCHEVTVIKGRRFPTCRHCKGVAFELVYAAKHVADVPHLHEEATAGAAH